MKKIITLVSILVFALSTINSQNGTNHLKIHAGAELTTGLFADGYNTGWGIYATDYFSLSKDGSIVLSTGIGSWNQKTGSGKAGMSLTRIGYRQFFAKGFYFQGDAGIGLGLENFRGSTRFTFGGGPGYLLKIKNGDGFDISARVNRGFNRTWIGLGVGYQFRI